MKIPLNPEIFTRGVQEIITAGELENLLSSERPLRIKHGIDATAADLHIGHATNLWKLRKLQEAGHKAVILLGDVTTEIGDPTGRSKTRPILNRIEIQKNIRAIEKVVKKILLTAPRLLEIRKSSEWYGKMKTRDILSLLSMVTHARLIERDMFERRIRAGDEIFMHELIYPILQGYDSVALRADLTIIGSDQIFNEHMGRFLQEKFGQRPQVIVALKLIPGIDGGEKMSKSLGNYIGLSDTPADKFGKAMRILDSLIIPYLEIYTDISQGEIDQWIKKLKEGTNPRDAKLFLAESLVARYHSTRAAGAERERFLKIFSRKEFTDIPVVTLTHKTYNPLDLLLDLKFAASRSEARRLISQGAVEVDGRTVKDLHDKVDVGENTLVQVGKRKFARIK